VVSPTPRPLYPPGKTRYPLYRRLGWPDWTCAKNFAHTGIRSKDRSSQSVAIVYHNAVAISTTPASYDITMCVEGSGGLKKAQMKF
jgi:hypothetical protein